MTKGIVYCFEIININNHQRIAVRILLRQSLLYIHKACVAVQQIRQRVMSRSIFHITRMCNIRKGQNKMAQAS